MATHALTTNVVPITSAVRYVPPPQAPEPAPLCKSPELALFLAMFHAQTPKQRLKTRAAIEELVRRDPDDVSAQTVYHFVGKCL